MSKPFMTRSKDLKKSTSYWGSLTLPYMTAGQFIIGSCGYIVVLETACILTYLAFLFHEAMDGYWAVQVPGWLHAICPG